MSNCGDNCAFQWFGTTGRHAPDYADKRKIVDGVAAIRRKIYVSGIQKFIDILYIVLRT
jgi:hypothetical protein